mmetsp:Transcript_64807/g.97656  ORF Transcript_64807/g.97656 Transcript_64807/m.97656 type:complete len:83 (-) Transcript_64807:351-599(-)
MKLLLCRANSAVVVTNSSTAKWWLPLLLLQSSVGINKLQLLLISIKQFHGRDTALEARGGGAASIAKTAAAQTLPENASPRV